MRNFTSPIAEHLLQKPIFDSLAHRMLILYCVVAALSIVAAQIVLGLLLLYWVCFILQYYPLKFDSFLPQISTKQRKLFFSAFLIPVSLWVLTGVISTIIGINVSRAAKEIGSTILHLSLPLMVAWLLCNEPITSQRAHKIRAYIVALCFGQGLAALHSIASAALDYDLPPKIPGPVTESGQLVLVLPLGVALAFLLLAESISKKTWILFLNAFLLFASSLLLAWPMISKVDYIFMVQVFAAIGAAASLGYFVLKTVEHENDLSEQHGLAFVLLLVTLLAAATIINLKRGPWLGLSVAFAIVGWIYFRRLLIIGVCSILGIVTFVGPVKARLLSSLDHFVIQGGRRDMWALGVDLAERFPLGLGPGNARYMRIIDPTLPELHRHMHNNLLNVTVEYGWLGLFCYLFWFIALLSLGFSLWKQFRCAKFSDAPEVALYALCFSAALLGWQAAGIVEYNFGDGEIRLMAFFIMGLLLSLLSWTPSDDSEKGISSPSE